MRNDLDFEPRLTKADYVVITFGVVACIVYVVGLATL